ncbi:tyrosine-type recombinase/integrase [Prevotella melaninogenica]|uniref:Tyrosine recombinase XerC n=1 Tax=Prevotella melaninogenica TaxID=28132 RepID=A0A250KG53_9BACT|nr:tyrosine-type recombinase/integrase [Prevotella melaninogenica]BBA28638.1 tyrosine recombinase XerC [Prevotella melaninogenica]
MELNQLISVNFNLRKPKSSTPTPLYMVVYYVDDKGKAIQAKIPTRRKVHPSLWDSRKQQPIMINKGIDLTTKQLQEQAELTAYIANCRILVYSEKNLNFDEIKESITQQSSNNDMSVTPQFKAATRTAKATKLISEALKKYTKDRQNKASTASEYQKNVKVFYNWIVETNQRDSAKALSQSSFNAFVEWMKAAGNSPQNVNKIASVIRQLIKYIAGSTQGSKYGITPVTYTPIKQVKEEKKCELTKEEIEAFKAVKVKNDKQQYYKDVFLLQLLTGQRISDTLKLIKGDYKVQKGTPCNTIILTTIKRNTTSYITETKEVTDLLEKIRSNKENETENEKDTSLTRYLKVFFTRANITRLTPSGKPLNEVISSHFARHTFVTIKLREGYKYEQVGKMIGDSALMIEKVYGHPTDTDIIATLQLQPANTPAIPAEQPATKAAPQVAAAPAVAKDKDLDYYNDLSDDDKLLNIKKLNDYNVLKDDFFKSLERQTDKKRKATAEAKIREILQVWGFEGYNNMNYNKLCFLLDLIKHDINDFILTYKVYNEKAPQGSISAINDYERLLINIGKLARYCHL